MKVAKEFKFWNSTTRVSQGYFVEVDLAEFPQLESFARESYKSNWKVHDFLSYVAIRRAYALAVKEGVISNEQMAELMGPFRDEAKFEDEVILSGR